MKRTILFLLALLCVGAANGTVNAQIGATKSGDARVSRALNNTKLKYTVDKDGDFKLTFDVGNGRTQVAYVMTTTEQLGNLEIREIRSYAMITEGSVSGATANMLLQNNFNTKLALWGIQKSGTKSAVLCIVRVAADSSGETLETALKTAAQQADLLEKGLTSGDEF